MISRNDMFFSEMDKKELGTVLLRYTTVINEQISYKLC